MKKFDENLTKHLDYVLKNANEVDVVDYFYWNKPEFLLKIVEITTNQNLSETESRSKYLQLEFDFAS